MRWVINATPRLLYCRKRPSIHCIGGWVGPRAGLDWCGKSRPHQHKMYLQIKIVFGGVAVLLIKTVHVVMLRSDA